MLCHRKQERGDFISFRLVPILLFCSVARTKELRQFTKETQMQV